MRKIVILAIIIEACMIILPELTRRAAREENRPENILTGKPELIGTGVRSARLESGAVRHLPEPEPAENAYASREPSGSDIYARHEISTYVKSELLGYQNRGGQTARDALFFMPILARFGILLPDSDAHFVGAWNSGRLFDFNGKMYLSAHDGGVGLVFTLN